LKKLKKKKKIVVSGVNLVEAGPLTVMQQCLDILDKDYSSEFEIIALVNNKNLFKSEHIKFYEFPKSKKLWIFRLFYEYIYFKILSKKLNPYIWFSIHDISANVAAEKTYVYCHNPTPFFKPNLSDWKFNFINAIWSKLYIYLYRINIKKNTYVIVQQDWIRKKFIQRFGINNIIVAQPNIGNQIKALKLPTDSQSKKFKFLYPAFPRSFKNFEVICEAVKLLDESITNQIEIVLTIDNSLNGYSKKIFRKYNNLSAIKFIGIQPKDKVYELYNSCDCLIFPSRLETWGLPITEFKITNKPILLANLPYAHETIGDYDRAAFFNPYDPHELANLIQKLILDDLEFTPHRLNPIARPYAANWKELLDILIYE
jgi:glycosyltransferase involved in cell wall biosynthesis